MIKVLQIINTFNVGGAERVVLDYFHHMDKTKFTLLGVSLAAKSNSIYDKEIEESGLQIIYLNKKKKYDLSLSKKIIAVIESFKPDIVHTHLGVLPYMKGIVKKNKNIRFFHTIHNDPHKDASFIHYYFNRRVLKLKNVTPIALNNEYRTSADKYYKVNKTIVLNNGIDTKKYEFKNRNYLTNEEITIGHIGRFVEQKNHIFIIDVFQKIHELNNKAKLVLVGDGPLRADIQKCVNEKKLEDYVIFRGIQKDIPSELNRFDIFFFPSLFEGLSIVLLEAQYSGLKCVISDRIDSEGIITNLVTKLSLEDDKTKWAKELLDTRDYNKIEKYDKYKELDINFIVKKLELIYLKALNG